MPWKLSYTRDQAVESLSTAKSWADALRRLGLAPHGKNLTTLRKWVAVWKIDTPHLPPHRPRRSGPRFTELQAREAIARSRSWTEALRRLGYCPTGGNPQTLKTWVKRWGIPTDHFDPWAANRDALGRAHQRTPLEDILVKGSTYSRSNLKLRLYEAGLKKPTCEFCTQGETWRGRPMGLILDHINGIRNDNRLENLRILCPNCAATLDTHCGRNGRVIPFIRKCERCDREFRVKYRIHRYCSRECGSRWNRRTASKGHFGVPNPGRRKVDRPPYEQLSREIQEMGYLAVGRKYGVSDNAVRKWVLFYEREAERKRQLTAGHGGADGVEVGGSSRGDGRPLRLFVDADDDGAPAQWVGGHQLRIAEH